LNWYRTIYVVLMCGLLTASGIALWADDSQSGDGEKKPPAGNAAEKPEADTISDSDAKNQDNESRYMALIAGLTIFMLAIFVGFEIITKVPPTLHTPLMSGSNAISGITLVGAVIVAGIDGSPFSYTLGAIAVALATVNVVGGFLVTHRMLAMFKKKK
jgi:NAD(P) transhydrogenase subunit alpha